MFRSFFPPMLALTSQNLRLRKCQPRSLDWALRNAMYVSANVKVPQFPQSVDKMLEVKSSDAVRIWMNSFACWAIQAIPHCFAEKPDFSQLLQVQRLEAKHGASEHFWDSFNSVEYTSRFQHISTKYCNICNSLGSRLPQNLKYSYPTCLAQGFKFAGLHQPGSGPRTGDVSDNWVHPLRREDKAPEPPLAPWHAKNFRNKHWLSHSKLNLRWRLNVQNWPSGKLAILRWSNQPLKIEPVRKPVHVDSAEKI